MTSGGLLAAVLRSIVLAEIDGWIVGELVPGPAGRYRASD